MKEEKTLVALSLSEDATVTAVRHEGSMHRRLLDLGFLSGTPVRCVGESPLGDPRAYLIRGTVIALRGEDAAHVLCTITK